MHIQTTKRNNNNNKNVCKLCLYKRAENCISWYTILFDIGFIHIIQLFHII